MSIARKRAYASTPVEAARVSGRHRACAEENGAQIAASERRGSQHHVASCEESQRKQAAIVAEDVAPLGW